MKGPSLGPSGKDITWPDQVAARSRRMPRTRKNETPTSNLKPGVSAGYSPKDICCQHRNWAPRGGETWGIPHGTV